MILRGVAPHHRNDLVKLTVAQNSQLGSQGRFPPRRKLRSQLRSELRSQLHRWLTALPQAEQHGLGSALSKGRGHLDKKVRSKPCS